MLNKWSMRLAAGLLLLTSVSVSAEMRQLEIDYNGQEFRGETTLKLKQEIKRAYPRLDIERAELERVVLVAKSKAGNAQARLLVGRYDSRIEQIDGNRWDFDTAGNFHRIPFEAPNRDNGVWQIEMRGNIKVKKVLVDVMMECRRPQQVTRECGYVLETIWGKDIKKFRSTETGPEGSGVQARACQQARKKCEALSDSVPLSKCTKL